jgi:hypothetical protein
MQKPNSRPTASPYAPCAGKDAFPRVPDFAGREGDAVERVPPWTITSPRAAAGAPTAAQEKHERVPPNPSAGWALPPGFQIASGRHVPGLYDACTTHVPCMYLACTMHVPRMYLACTWLALGLHLVCTSHVPGFRRPCPACFLLSAFAWWWLWGGFRVALGSHWGRIGVALG